jgi:GH24 family phage-related lysozyme (muramidase)
MQLSELFVSHKQVDPVSFTKSDPELPKSIYYNLGRAQAALSPDSEEMASNMSTWKVGGNGSYPQYSWVVQYAKPIADNNPKPENVKDSKQDPKQGTPEVKTEDVSMDRLVDFLKRHEGFRNRTYYDTGGIPTIGYGFTDPKLTIRGYISQEEALRILRDVEIPTRERKLQKQIKSWDKLSKNQRDSLISYGFNVGVENWAKSQPKLLAALNEERFADAAKYMDAVRDAKGNILPGLVTRRKEEQAWFNS